MTDQDAKPRSPSDTTLRIAASVRAELARANVSARGLAERLKYTHTAMNRRLRGHTAFRPDELEAIAAVLDVPVSRLYEAPRDADDAPAAHTG